MILERHRVADFRNLQALTLQPGRGLTVLVGQNGAGKTNLLESIYFVATQRPLRPAKLVELVREGCERTSVVATLRGELTTEIRVTVESGRRRASIGEKAIRSLARWAELLPVVAFTPDDLEIAKAGPRARRAWLDRAVFGRFPAHLEASRRYARAVASRNRLLREGRGSDAAAIESYDPILAREGARILCWRRALLEAVTPRAVEVLGAILGAGEDGLEIAYRSRIEVGGDEEEIEARILEALATTRAEERSRARTCVGPHLADVELRLGGKALRAYGSQGQQRSVVLALKIAEIETMREAMGRAPLLLLDDISSELDPTRRSALLAYLRDFPGQTLLTTTDLSSIEPGVLEAATLFTVAKGRLEEGRPGAE